MKRKPRQEVRGPETFLLLMNSACQGMKYGRDSHRLVSGQLCLHSSPWVPSRLPLTGVRMPVMWDTLVRDPLSSNLGCPAAHILLHHGANSLPVPSRPGLKFMVSIWQDNSPRSKWFYMALCRLPLLPSCINGIVPFCKNYCLRPQARFPIS
jgi:hypothetical protein